MRIPLATYRIQFHSHFGFIKAKHIIDYLSSLGISDIYASPILKSRKGSTHGYDVVDPNQINFELGTQEEFDQLITECKAKDIGWLQDIVPNHMAYDSDNKMLMDVFESGPVSTFLNYFDVIFEHPYENLKNKILAPFLGEFYGDCIDQKQIQIRFNELGFSIQYADFTLPLKIDSYLKLLTYNLSLLAEKFGSSNEILLKFLEITQVLKDLSFVGESSERGRQIFLIKSRLWGLYSTNEIIKDYLDTMIQKLNSPGLLDLSFDLDKLLDEQFFRLSFWKVGNEELNYRRFFTINGLICLRMENPDAFEYIHRLIFQWLAEGKITGLRVDHLDGLYDPADYLRHLKEKTNDAYVVVEKILDLREELPFYFNTQGTTGYDFLNYLNGIFVEPKNEKKIERIFEGFTQKKIHYHSLVSEKKRLFIGRYMAGDIDNLAHLLKRLLNRNRYGKDLTMYALRRALVEIMAQFPVYRTYIDTEKLNDNDKKCVKEAFSRARGNNPGMVYELDALEKIFLLNFDLDIEREEKNEWFHFIKKFQQFTGPLMAKAGEDTTFYIYNRLISLNEVGSDPSVFGISVKNFHEFNLYRQEHWPFSMNASSTHDTKRGEDVRSRINVLSELPKEWNFAVKTWSKINQSKKRSLNKLLAPDKDDEYFIYQTLIGAFPFIDTDFGSFKQRMKEYIVKAVREAKVHTAWIKPDTEYEEACVNFIDGILGFRDFLDVFVPFQKRISFYGVFNSLSQTLLKITSPGVVDFYQGSELWDLNLVDPDNRRPVDYEARIKILDDFKKEEDDLLKVVQQLLKDPSDGRIKLFLIYRGLQCRKAFKQLFQKGNYVPLNVSGLWHNNLIAFGRCHKNDYSVTIVPRFLTQIFSDKQLPLGEPWRDTSVAISSVWPKAWRNVMTGEELICGEAIPVSQALKRFPVGLFSSQKK
jgi:(1->4)-alpha-D-glucan 1-alpha-D-glucosylmutase